MRILKKMAAVLMAAVCVMGCFTGCGSTSGSGSSGSVKTVADVKAAGKLKVGCKSDTINIGLLNSSTGEYEGYEIDLAYEIAGKIFDCTADEARAQKLVEFTSVTAKTRGGLLDNGELDCVIAAFTVTDERKNSWNFTQQYRLEPVSFLVNKSSGVKSIADMNGYIIGVGQGTTTASLMEEYVKDKGISVNYTVQDFQYISDGVAALKSGQIDAYSVDRMALAAYQDDTTMLTEDAFGIQEIGIALKKGNDELTTYMDDIITELKSSGKLDTMKQKWGVLTDDEVNSMK